MYYKDQMSYMLHKHNVIVLHSAISDITANKLIGINVHLLHNKNNHNVTYKRIMIMTSQFGQ